MSAFVSAAFSFFLFLPTADNISKKGCFLSCTIVNFVCLLLFKTGRFFFFFFRSQTN